MRWLERLIRVLEDEIAVIGEMRKLLAREREAVVRGDIDAVLSVSKKKETLGLKHKLLEEARVACLQKAGRANATLSQLMEELAPPERDVLKKLYERLKEQVENLMWENKRNLLFINKALEVNRELVRVFSSCYGLSYDSSGKLSSDLSKGKIQLRG